MPDKYRIGFYWAASCGGCEIAVLDTNEKILDVLSKAEIILWPVAVDTKYADVRALPDGAIDACFFNGSIRNSEQQEIAELLRRKSKLLFAFGSCAQHGCIPGLANLHSRAEIFKTAYHNEPSVTNPEKVEPATRVTVPEGELTLPEFYDRVYPLDRVVTVDYYLPGCPPPVALISEAWDMLFSGRLPARGSVLAPAKALCEECQRNKHTAKRMPDIKRTWEVAADPQTCFLEQGIVCMGPATRGGCGQRCINGNWPCTGCMGPMPDVEDQGSKMVSALSAILKLDEEKDLGDAGTEQLMAKVKDPVGTFYMYGLAGSTLNQGRKQ